MKNISFFCRRLQHNFGRSLFCSIHSCEDGKDSDFYLRSPDCILLGAGLESSSIYLDWLFLPGSSAAASDSMTCAVNATSEIMISSIALVHAFNGIQKSLTF